jgi:hypothetical protein
MLKFFSSRLEPEALATKLKEVVAEEIVDPQSRTLYSGDLPFIGRVSVERFAIRRRSPIFWALWWLTPGRWFQPIVDGTVRKSEDGTMIEIVGATPVWTKIFWTLALLGAASSIVLLIFFYYPYGIAHDPARSATNLILGIVFLSIVAGVFVLLPLIGWLLTKNDIPTIMRELENRLGLIPVE